MSENAYYPGCVMLREPRCILSGANGSDSMPIGIAGSEHFLGSLAGPTVFFVCPMWTLTSDWFRMPVLTSLESCQKRYPQHKYVLLINDARELDHVESLDVSVERYICGEIAAVDPDVFCTFAKPTTILYDAIYLARVEQYKRLALASSVANLAILSRGLTREKVSELQGICPNAVLPNLVRDEIVEYQAHEVAALLPSARCGLILSAREGQNRATSEYLLSGLPVITTPSCGGRDRLLTPANSIFVEPRPEAVARAVEFIKLNPFDADSIRKGAVEAIMREKLLLTAIVDCVIQRFGFGALGGRTIDLPHHGSSSTRPFSHFVS